MAFKVRYFTDNSEEQIRKIISLFLASQQSELKIEIISSTYDEGFEAGYKAGIEFSNKVIIDDIP
jgi:hypothetical protein